MAEISLSIVPFQAGDYRKLTQTLIALQELSLSYWEKGNDSQASWIAERAKEITAHRDIHAALLSRCEAPTADPRPPLEKPKYPGPCPTCGRPRESRGAV